jgi:hypothetical protein
MNGILTETGTRWARVTRHRPCCICGKIDWCGTSPDGTLACCMRVQSGRPAKNGGWLHRIAGAPVRPIPRPSMPQAQRPRACTVDWAAMLRRFGRDTAATEVERLAAMLGVSADSLFHLGVVWAAPHHAWGFPMRDASQAVIGIRLRAETGRKWAVTGSHNGLFWPECLTGAGPLLICEGPTDTAALLDLGYDTLGRPSCAGNIELVVAAVSILHHRHVIIVADADEHGLNGADRLARALTEAGHRPKVIRPLVGKDARAWVQAGATRAVVDAVIAKARYWRAPGG